MDPNKEREELIQAIDSLKSQFVTDNVDSKIKQVESFKHKGDQHMGNKHFQKAASAYMKAHTFVPIACSPQLLYSLYMNFALAWFHIRKPEKAIEFLERIPYGPHLPAKYFYRLGIYLFEMCSYDRSEAAYAECQRRLGPTEDPQRIHLNEAIHNLEHRIGRPFNPSVRFEAPAGHGFARLQ
eukprot:gnl/Trimastix_PCT/4546.p1 GENE.gnl/Trimastix_PCT/4546~~gnl/Trimastix_PCT/4546.p1  ORF type:complete len:182 (+),score=19.47 gnl/Trimastix_PCT/4546:72-617(+)